MSALSQWGSKVLSNPKDYSRKFFTALIGVLFTGFGLVYVFSLVAGPDDGFAVAFLLLYSMIWVFFYVPVAAIGSYLMGKNIPFGVIAYAVIVFDIILVLLFSFEFSISVLFAELIFGW